MTVSLNPNIEIIEPERKLHSKASEEYLHVRFTYEGSTWDGWVPVEYRRTGVSLKTQDELIEHLNAVYEQMKPVHRAAWKVKQDLFWAEKSKAQTTKAFF